VVETAALSGCIGTEVTGADIGQPLDDATYELLHRALLDSNGVLVFRGQFLSPEGQHSFAERWGTPVVTPHLAPHSYPGCPAVLRVTNVGKENAVTENWHTDSIFLDHPPDLTILAAQEIPAAGGDTMWANLYAAYDRLSPAMQRLLAPLQGQFLGSQPDPDTGESRQVIGLHPIVRTHPETGRQALLIGRPGESVIGFEGMTQEESRPLLDFLYRHGTQPDLIYRHHWSPGDVVMWDNRCTAHYAVHDYGQTPRTLSRVTVNL
jgi:taurine dioxygenase